MNTGAPTRTLSYIEDHYVKVTEPISFDNLSDGMTYDAPTKDNNVAPNPSKWELRHYGFVYKKLADDSKFPVTGGLMIVPMRRFMVNMEFTRLLM